MQTLRLFISSPSDVRNERQIAGKVIARLQGKYWSFVRLEDVFWERSVARATAHFQEELRNPGECDIVVGILWSLLGSPLPERFRGLRGESHATGTEWELAQAFEAYEKSLSETSDPVAAKPDVIVYRRTDEPDADDKEARHQRDALEAYLRREFHNDDAHGTIRRSLSRYQGLEEFEKRLHDDLEALILRRLPSLAPGFDPPPISGNPFMGLSVFDYDDADRFFGRTRAIREVRDRLRERAASGTAFVLIYGASGHGKSSLMRAGVAPAVTRPGGALAGMDRWRRVLLLPGMGSGSLCERLARAILAPASDEELERARLNDLYAHSGFPELAGHGIPDPAADGLTWDVASLARYLADPEDQVFAAAGIAGALETEGLCLLLQIDQLEEVFAEGVDAEERTRFFRALHGLAGNGRAWVIATLRSEFFPRIAGEDALRDLVGRDGGCILPPPDLQSWNEIVRYPALAARLDYEQQVEFREIAGVPSTEEWLHEQILADIGGNPDVLPLLEFCLQRLYHDLLDSADPEGQRRGNRLSWESYAAMGGLNGSIATAAETAYAKLSPSAQGARDFLFGNLVRFDETVTRRRADLKELEKRPGAAAFIAAFREAKLLVADEDAGRAVMTLAHESLLTHWPVLAEWIEEHRIDLAAHQRLIKQAQLWAEHGKDRKYLVAEGHLAEAERGASPTYFQLSDQQAEFLRDSRSAARKRLRRFQVATLVFALLAIGAGVLAWVAENSKNQATAAKIKAETERIQAEQVIAFIEHELVYEIQTRLPARVTAGINEVVESYYEKTGRDRSGESKALLSSHIRQLGESKLNAGLYSEAFFLYKKGFEILLEIEEDSPETANLKSDQGLFLSRIGDTLHRMGLFSYAYKIYIEVLKTRLSLMADSPDHPELVEHTAHTYHDIAVIETSLGSTTDAKSNLKEAMDLIDRAIRRSGSERDLYAMKVEILNLSGVIDANEGNFEQAIETFSDSLVESSKLLDLDSTDDLVLRCKCIAQENLGYCFHAIGKTSEALAMLKSAIEIQDEISSRRPSELLVTINLTDALREIGDIEYSLGNRELALEFFLRAKKNAKTLAEKFPFHQRFQVDLAENHARLSHYLIDENRDEEAIAELEDAFSTLNNVIGNSPEASEYRLLYGYILYLGGKLALKTSQSETAIAKFQSAITELEYLGENSTSATNGRRESLLILCLSGLSEANESLGRLEESISIHKKIIALHEKYPNLGNGSFSDETDSIESLAKLGDLLLNLERFPEAISFYKQGLVISERIQGNPANRKCGLQNVSALNGRIGDVEIALDRVEAAHERKRKAEHLLRRAS